LGFVAEGYGWYGYDSVVSSGDRVVQVGSSLAFLRTTSRYDEVGRWVTEQGFIDVVDLSEPESPHLARVELARVSGLTGLFADGDTVLTSHFEALSDGS